MFYQLETVSSLAERQLNCEVLEHSDDHTDMVHYIRFLKCSFFLTFGGCQMV